MPTPELRWGEYEVRLPRTSPLIGLDTRSRSTFAVDEPVVATQLELPDLSAWQSPLDKAKILLESAAEIEHALMVQYLYAAYSLKSKEEVTDTKQKKVLNEGSAASWPNILLGIAREEMGHLLTVQNLLLALGLAPNLEREDFPPRKDLYPFALHLEPLTQQSLAKYVVAEAPVDASDIDDIIAVACESRGAEINHVGVLYGLLGVVFATKEQVEEGAASDDSWHATVSQLAELAHQHAPPAESWHLPESAFQVGFPEQQAVPSDWQVGGVRVHAVTDRETARVAIRDIGEQGEGPTVGGEQSHFERFRRLYRGDGAPLAFPAGEPAGEWVPTRRVSKDPRVGDIADQRTRRWAELADLRYGLLLGLVEHYLLTTGDDRKLLTAWIFAEMRTRVGFLARKLTAMPTGDGDGVASIPFTLPVPLHLPGAETARWTVHKRRIEAAVAKVQEIQATPTDDETELSYLSGLLTSDRARLALIETRTIPATTTTSFARDILPLFRPVDIKHMSGLDLDLSTHETVKDKAQIIFDRLTHADPDLRVMPPPPHQPWTKAQTDLFERWKEEGFPA
jgi:hypothetical protein